MVLSARWSQETGKQRRQTPDYIVWTLRSSHTYFQSFQKCEGWGRRGDFFPFKLWVRFVTCKQKSPERATQFPFLKYTTYMVITPKCLPPAQIAVKLQTNICKQLPSRTLYLVFQRIKTKLFSSRSQLSLNFFHLSQQHTSTLPGFRSRNLGVILDNPIPPLSPS